jgi:hypothetical protein
VVLLVAVVALGAAIAGAVVGAREADQAEPGAVMGRAERPLEQVSFLAKIIPASGGGGQARGPGVPRSVGDLARRLPVERKVAQLFLFGFEGTDLNAEIFRRLRRLDLGGIVIASENYADPGLLGQLGGEARARPPPRCAG